jgi:hypothetical protein
VSRLEKLIEKFLSDPKDFTWEELTKVLASYGYEEISHGKTGGSRRKFVDKNKRVIALHKPHPSNIVKSYVVNNIIAHLKETSKLK